MTTEQILETYPGPWRVETQKNAKRGTCHVLLVDYNGNQVAEVFGENQKEAEALAAIMCRVPDCITLSQI